MAADGDSAGPQQRHSDGANGASGMHPRHEYRILASQETEGDSATAGPWVRGAGHGAIRGKADRGQMETEKEDKTGQRALLACGV